MDKYTNNIGVDPAYYTEYQDYLNDVENLDFDEVFEKQISY